VELLELGQKEVWVGTVLSGALWLSAVAVVLVGL
jgi:hypothetical protein